MTASTLLTLDQINQLALSVLDVHGFSTEQAQAIAQTITAAERDGCVSHGLFRISFYVNALKNADADARATPTVSLSDSSVVHVDARHGFCPLALQMGLPALTEKANSHGIAALAIHNTYNIAALWPEVEKLASEGLVAFAFTAANAYVAPAGGTEAVYGTNPMAFAFPREGHLPLVFDQASSASARGEIQLHQRAGKPIPEGWAIDAQGNPTTDAEAALKGAQLPFGGYKGAALALMVELLAGALIGENFSVESSAHDKHGIGAPFGGELLLALNPRHFTSSSYQQRAETLFSRILEQPGTRLPSDRRYALRGEHLQSGVEVSSKTIDELHQLRDVGAQP